MQRDGHSSMGQFGNASWCVHVDLVFRDLGENGKLVCFLKTSEARGHAPSLWSDRDDRRVGPVCGGDGGHKIGDPGSVLRNADAVTTDDS